MAFNPDVIKNLKPFNADNARKMQEKSVVARKLNTEIRETLKITAEQWVKVKADLPKMDPLDVLEMCMVKALADNDIDAASRYASLLAPYRSPKLQAIEQRITTDVSTMTDDDLRKLIADEGIKLLEETPNDNTD